MNSLIFPTFLNIHDPPHFVADDPPHFVAEFERELRTLRNLIVHAKIS
jgi:hypothetical protein